jgi:hypothetical protein
MKLMTHMTIFQLGVTSFCLSPLVRAANEIALFQGDFTAEETTDKISRRIINLSFRNHRRDLTYPYPEEANSAWDFGIQTQNIFGNSSVHDYAGYQIALLAGYKFSPQYLLETSLGSHWLNNGSTGQSHHTFPWSLQAIGMWSEKIVASMRLNHNFAHEGTLPGGVTDALTMLTWSPQVSIKPLERVKVQFRGMLKNFSDHNRFRQVESSILYGFLPGSPWLWAGIGVEAFSYAETKTTYWSPEHFTAYGPRIETTLPLFGACSVSFGGNYNWVYEKVLDLHGTSYYLMSQLQYGNRATGIVALYWIPNSTWGTSTQWSSNQVGIKFSASY